MNSALSNMVGILPYFLAAGVLSLGITKLCTILMPRIGMVDIPRDRHMHKAPTPVGGGIAISLTFFILGSCFVILHCGIGSCFDVFAVRGFFIPAAVITVTGVIDDRFELKSLVKLAVQVGVAVYFYFAGVSIDSVGGIILPDWLSLLLTVCWTVGIINAFNLIDGLDGVAAGLSAISAFFLAFLSLNNDNPVLALFSMIVCGACLGFLRYNFHPARIFMGDTGSMFLGFILAGISVIGAVKCAATIALIVPILALGVPIMDTTFAIIRRYRGGVPIFKPDKGHLHHRLLDLGFSQKQAVLLMYVISALLGLSAVVLNEVSGSMSIVIVVCVLLVVFMGAKKLGIFRLKTK